MKRFSILSLLSVPLLLLICSTCSAEFAKVVDADEYVNVRQEQRVSSPIIGQVASGDFAYVTGRYSSKGNDWLQLRPEYEDYEQWDFPEGEDWGVVGFIHNSRVQPINEDSHGLATEILMSYFDKSAGRIEFSDNEGNMIVAIQTEDFNYPANAHKFTEVHTSNSWGDSVYLSHYNGQRFWGTDGSIPYDTNHYKSITVHLDDRIISIPKRDIESLFNIYLKDTRVYFNELTDSVYVSISEGHGAGFYSALFAIEDGDYIGITNIGPYSID